MALASTRKKPSKRVDGEEIWPDLGGSAVWRVKEGELVRGPGNPGRIKPLFETVAEKLPYDSLRSVQKSMEYWQLRCQGIYLAHDSMGCVRYVGRGNVFNRLAARRREQFHELVYYSFYIIAKKIHERELETLLIRTAGPMLTFNERKKRTGIDPGSIRDYEPGTFYYRRLPSDARKSASSD